MDPPSVRRRMCLSSRGDAAHEVLDQVVGDLLLAEPAVRPHRHRAGTRAAARSTARQPVPRREEVCPLRMSPTAAASCLPTTRLVLVGLLVKLSPGLRPAEHRTAGRHDCAGRRGRPEPIRRSTVRTAVTERPQSDAQGDRRRNGMLRNGPSRRWAGRVATAVVALLAAGAPAQAAHATTPAPDDGVAARRTAQPIAIVYADDTDAARAYAAPGGMVVAGRENYAAPAFRDVAAAGGTVLVYLAPTILQPFGRHRSMLFERSDCGPAVPGVAGRAGQRVGHAVRPARGRGTGRHAAVRAGDHGRGEPAHGRVVRRRAGQPALGHGLGVVVDGREGGVLRRRCRAHLHVPPGCGPARAARRRQRHAWNGGSIETTGGGYRT